jgi:hypothetical protein
MNLERNIHPHIPRVYAMNVPITTTLPSNSGYTRSESEWGEARRGELQADSCITIPVSELF